MSGEKLFEALKLGKKIPDSEHFLFKGSAFTTQPYESDC
jgi:hypothetical protein